MALSYCSHDGQMWELAVCLAEFLQIVLGAYYNLGSVCHAVLNINI